MTNYHDLTALNNIYVSDVHTGLSDQSECEFG